MLITLMTEKEVLNYQKENEKKPIWYFSQITNNAKRIWHTLWLTALMLAGSTGYAQDNGNKTPNITQTEKTIDQNTSVGMPEVYSTLLIKWTEIIIENSEDGTMKLRGFYFEWVDENTFLWRINDASQENEEWLYNYNKKLKTINERKFEIPTPNEQEAKNLLIALMRIELELKKNNISASVYYMWDHILLKAKKKK